MADPVSIQLTNNGKINLQASADAIELSAQTSASLLEAVANNEPFTTSETVADGKLTAAGDGDFVFDGGEGSVTFKGNAVAGASLATFFEPSALAASLAEPLGDPASGHTGLPAELTETLASSFATPSLDEELLLALRWGYEIDVAASGKLALSASGNATFGFDGRTAGLFAICRRLPSATGARDAITDLLGNWMLPRQVAAASDLSPGTWLVAQVDGGLALKVGAQLGYDFSWVRGIELGELTGDIALKIQLGVAASVGFSASGRYALVVSRESPDQASERLRIRLFKLGKRGWSFGFDLGAEVDPKTPQPSLDEFVQAVFGIQAAQLLGDLDRLADPQTSLTKILGDEAADYLKGLLEEVTGLDVDASLAEANAQLERALARWRQLDHEVAAKIWQKLEDQNALRDIRGLAEKISAAPDVPALIAERLAKTGFLSTAGAEWLETLAPQGLIDLLDRAGTAQQRVKDAADKTLEILDESTVEKTVAKLKSYLAERFGVDEMIAALDRAIAATDPGELDAWLARKLELFFDQTLDKSDPRLGVKLEQIRQALANVRGKSDVIWAKTIEALNRTYSAQFSYRYQSSTTRQALFDVEVDFGVDPQAAGDALRAVLAGDFHTVLLSDNAAVTLHEGTLTFGLERRGSVEISLPGFKKELTNLTSAWGKVTASEDDGRVLLYEAGATNQVDVDLALARVRRISSLSVTASLPVAARGNVRVHRPGTLRFSYALDEAVPKLTADQFLSQYRVYAEKYLPEEFPTDTGGATAGSFAAWVRELDDASDGAGWGSGILGNTLSALELSLSEEVGAAWLAGVVSGGEAALRAMSLEIQKALRDLVPFYYFQDVRQYGERSAEPLLVYAAVPPKTSFSVGAGGVLKKKEKGDIYWWDLNNETTFDALVFSNTTTRALATSCLEISRVLEHVPGMSKDARDYARVGPRVKNIQRSVQKGATLRKNLVSLFKMEARVIHAAERAARNLAGFQASAGKDPERAVEALTRFSADLAEAFNRELRPIYVKQAIRPLGTLVFLEAARAFSEALPDPRALLRVTILDPRVKPFPPTGFPEHPTPAAEDVIVQQAVVSIR